MRARVNRQRAVFLRVWMLLGFGSAVAGIINPDGWAFPVLGVLAFGALLSWGKRVVSDRVDEGRGEEEGE
jgi:hypothetical protein